MLTSLGARVACGIAAALVLTSCSMRVSGTATTAPTTPPPTTLAVKATPVDPKRMTGEAVLGDLTFLDMCLFLHAEDLGEFGKATLVNPDAFDACAVDIERADGELIEVIASDVDRAPDEIEGDLVDVGGGVKSVVLIEEPGVCAQGVVFADDVSFIVDVVAEKLEGDLCPVAAKAVAAMVARFDDGLVSKREIAANSLARVDACAVLPESAVADIPGVAKRSRSEVLTKHSCGIGSSADAAPFVSLEMLAGYAPRADEDGAVTETIAGRKTVVHDSTEEPIDGLVYCWVSTQQRSIVLAGVGRVSEYAIITVWLREADAQPGCPSAKAVAGKVWPRLPAR